MEIDTLYRIFLDSRNVSTDTRNIAHGSVFFALRGEKFDANAFAAEALQKGARYAVVDDPRVVRDDRYILVHDVLETLQQLAKHHRSTLTIPVVGLTGSNGKTTSKELVAAVLAKKHKTFATKGNLNNHIGVPLSILSITSDVEIAVIEMGANHVGEIALLSSIANPTHGFITNIGKAHIGTFGGFENIIRGKSELYQHLIASHGTVFINSTDPILSNMAKRFANPVFYPAVGNYYHCEFLGADPFVKLKTASGKIIETQLIGRYNFENIAVALCIGKYFGVPEDDALDAVHTYVPGNMRSQVMKRGSNTIILDAYNANPSSMKVAIENLEAMQGDRKVVILGDMYELEDESEREHQALGAMLLEKGFTEVYFCGKLIQSAMETMPKAKYFETKAALTSFLSSNPISDAIILIKASRGIGLETVVEFL